MFAKAKGGRAHGPDCIPPGLLKVAPEAMAKLFVPVLAKAASQGSEPLAWSGGTLVPLPKPKAGDVPTVVAFRPITVNDSVAKAWHSWIRQLLIHKVESLALDSQCGGLLGKGTDFTGHTAREFLATARHLGRSAAIVFTDL